MITIPSYLFVFVFLFLVNLQEKPARVFISRLKQEEQRKDKQNDKRLYRRVKKWELTELRIVDGRSQDTEVCTGGMYKGEGKGRGRGGGGAWIESDRRGSYHCYIPC